MVSAAFVALALLLTLLVAGVVLGPLWPRTRVLVIVLGCSMAVIALGLYRLLGAPLALDPDMVRAPSTLAEATTQLERRLAIAPGDTEGWLMLARAYAAQGLTSKAADAAARAARLAPANPDALVVAAEARALDAPAHRFDTQGVAWLDQALQSAPSHQRALWFRGIAARQAGQDAQAIAIWERLLPLVDDKTRAVLVPQLAQARTDAGAGTVPPAQPKPTALRVHVEASPELLKQAQNPDTAVFVIARAPGGPPMPIAVEKHRLGDLPLDITLDDADSPMPAAKLSSQSQVEVFARVSASGQPTRQEGDPESAPVQITLPASDTVRLRIEPATKAPR